MVVASRISSWTSGETPTPPVADTTQIGVSLGGGINYATVGIYTANAIDTTTPTVVDWGDGTTDSIIGDISQLIHTYAVDSRAYTVTISDNISSLALSANNSTWYGTTTYNQGNIRSVNLSHSITSIPAYGFYNIQRLEYFNGGSYGTLTFGDHAFEAAIGSYIGQPTVTFDFSGRTVATIPTACFKGRTWVTDIRLPQGVTTIGQEAFRDSMTASWITGKSIAIPEGVTTCGTQSLRFGTGLSELTLPSTLTSLGSKCLQGLVNVSVIRSNATAAPSTSSDTFGNVNFTSTWVGYNTKSSGNNTLYVPAGATGYTSNYWNDWLLNSSRCGFTKVEV